jgi:hypothetical protein
MITVVIISCGRAHLFKRTIESFMKFNTYPIEHYVVIEDSACKCAIDDIRNLCEANIEKDKLTFIVNENNIGEIASIDKAYAEVKTPFAFHLEDDWEFYREGFMEQSLKILESNPKIMQVWLMEHYDTNTHPIDPEVYSVGDVMYQLMSLNALGGAWHGFTWNPGLRRMADYKLVAPFAQFIAEGDFNALTECHIGRKYFEMGFRAAILMGGYVKHIGWGQQIDGVNTK